MNKRFRHVAGNREKLILLLLSVICLSVSLFRCWFTQTTLYLFLNWNLFLAFVPWALTSLFVIFKPFLKRKKLAMVALLLIWILFFPNSPYILTDLFHLRWSETMPLWFDLVMILTFAFTGLLFGFLSLIKLEKEMLKESTPILVKLSIIFLFFLSGFGVYIGRYLRWNSWDILTSPVLILSQITERIFTPMHNLNTWGMTLFLGLFLNIIFWTTKWLRYEK